MAVPLLVDFTRLKINQNTYNKILKNSIRLAKKIIMKKYLPNLRMVEIWSTLDVELAYSPPLIVL